MPMPIKTMKRKIKIRLHGLTEEAKISEIDKIIREIVWNVGDYRNLKYDLKRLKDSERAVMSIKHSSKNQYYVKKESPQTTIIGLPNSGKSTLLTTLTNSNAKIAEYPFTTQKTEIGSLKYNDVRIQMIELPPFYEGISTKNKELISLLRVTDGIISVINKPNELDILLNELERSKIELFNSWIDRNENYSDSITHIPSIVVYRDKQPETYLKTINFEKKIEIKESIYKQLDIKRIYTKNKDGIVDSSPVIFMGLEDVYVEDVIDRVNKRFLKKFKYAKLWGDEAKFDGEKIGLNRKLNDGDIITIYTRA